jgi:hypothetical protein
MPSTISLTGLTYLMFGSGFPTSYVVVFVVMRGGGVIARFVDIGGIEDSLPLDNWISNGNI